MRRKSLCLLELRAWSSRSRAFTIRDFARSS